jgi:hypothetical protein
MILEFSVQIHREDTWEDNIKKKFEIMLEDVDLIHFYFSIGGQLQAVTNVINDFC